MARHDDPVRCIFCEKVTAEVQTACQDHFAVFCMNNECYATGPWRKTRSGALRAWESRERPKFREAKAHTRNAKTHATARKCFRRDRK